MKMALAVSRGDPFLGRTTERRNVLYIDCETGKSTYAYRLRRLLEAEGLEMDAARDVHYWWTGGIPLEDQGDALKRCCEENDIGFLCLDHIAAACGGDASEQSVASRFSRALGKIGLPMLALAHITGAAVSDPEQARKPFGSIFWENNARRTIFVMRQQEDESPIADLGLYPRKINDGGRPAPFAARLTFNDPSGPISVDPIAWGANTVLSRVRGAEHAIFDVLARPQTVTWIAEETNLSERHVKRVLADHPKMFVTVSGTEFGGRGNAKYWARVARGQKQWWQDKEDVPF
jgi:hypothetical protein